MRKTLGRMLLVGMLLLMISGCSDGPIQEVVITDVVRIFYEGDRRYSLMIQKDGQQEAVIKTVDLGYDNNVIRFIFDIGPDQKMYVKYKYYQRWDGPSETIVAEFHARSPKDINGGGWSHGKFGRGTISVIE